LLPTIGSVLSKVDEAHLVFGLEPFTKSMVHWFYSLIASLNVSILLSYLPAV
jgi:hypothetical protein